MSFKGGSRWGRLVLLSVLVGILSVRGTILVGVAGLFGRRLVATLVRRGVLVGVALLVSVLVLIFVLVLVAVLFLIASMERVDEGADLLPEVHVAIGARRACTKGGTERQAQDDERPQYPQ